MSKFKNVIILILIPFLCYSQSTDNGDCISLETSITNIVACESYEWNGEIYTENGTYEYSEQNDNDYSVDLTSSGSYIDFGENINPTSQLTLMGWIYISDEFYQRTFIEKCDDNDNKLFLLGSDANANSIGFILDIDGQDYSISGSLNNWNSSLPFPREEWHHIAATYDGQTMKIYTDGVLDNMQQNVVGSLPISDAKTYFGDPIGGGGLSKSIFDNFSVWDVALTQEQIQSFMNCPPIGSETSLVGFWNFEEGEGNTVFDLSGNGNDGIINGASFSSNVPEQSCQLTTVNGCDSLAVLNLTINNPDTSFTEITACESYEWNGQSLIESGVYSYSGELDFFQIGQDIDGEYAGDQFGRESISINGDGNRIAIGGWKNSDNGYWSGHARVYEFDGVSWNQVGQDINGEASNDMSGLHLSLSSDGNILAVSARLNDDNGSNSGHVRVFNFDGVSWNQLGQDINGEGADDQFGTDISISSDGTIIAIGGYLNDGNGVNSGHVRVFEYINGSWSQLGADIDGEFSGDQSGGYLSLNSSGNIVAIGGPLNDGNGYRSGHVRVFEYINGSWSQLGADIDGENSEDYFGRGVSISDDGYTVAAGAPHNNDNGYDAGNVRVFNWNGTSWIQIGSNIEGEHTGDRFGEGTSMSSDGTIIAIGGYLNDGNGVNSGHVRVFENINNTWIQLGSDIDGESEGDYSGRKISLNNNGNIIAIGAGLNDGNGTESGHARIYNFSELTTINGCDNSNIKSYNKQF